VGLTLRMILLVVTLASVGMQLRTALRSTAGLSAATWLGMVASTIFWLGYGIGTSEVTMISINLPVLVMGLALVGVLIRTGVTTVARSAPYVVIPLLGWALAYVTGSVAILGWGGTLLVVGRLLPQLVTAVQSEDRSGISISAWVGNGGNKIVWATFGFSIGDAFVAWPAVVASFVSFSIVGLVLRGPPRPKVLAVGFAAAIDPPVTRDRAAA
jgi:uncharacterized protein with PQ loop repeat